MQSLSDSKRPVGDALVHVFEVYGAGLTAPQTPLAIPDFLPATLMAISMGVASNETVPMGLAAILAGGVVALSGLMIRQGVEFIHGKAAALSIAP